MGVKCGREADSFEWPDHWPTGVERVLFECKP